MNNSKWVCVTKSWDSFTYGKIYEGELLRSNKEIDGDLLNVPNDFGEYHLPALFRYEPIENYKESRRYYGIPRKKVYYFITLEEWREQQINKILYTSEEENL
jgi:hypothetical protein